MNEELGRLLSLSQAVDRYNYDLLSSLKFGNGGKSQPDADADGSSKASTATTRSSAAAQEKPPEPTTLFAAQSGMYQLVSLAASRVAAFIEDHLEASSGPPCVPATGKPMTVFLVDEAAIADLTLVAARKHELQAILEQADALERGMDRPARDLEEISRTAKVGTLSVDQLDRRASAAEAASKVAATASMVSAAATGVGIAELAYGFVTDVLPTFLPTHEYKVEGITVDREALHAALASALLNHCDVVDPLAAPPLPLGDVAPDGSLLDTIDKLRSKLETLEAKSAGLKDGAGPNVQKFVESARKVLEAIENPPNEDHPTLPALLKADVLHTLLPKNPDCLRFLECHVHVAGASTHIVKRWQLARARFNVEMGVTVSYRLLDASGRVRSAKLFSLTRLAHDVFGEAQSPGDLALLGATSMGDESGSPRVRSGTR